MKSKNRIKNYTEGTKDWIAQYDMLLEDGVTCGDCYHCTKCVSIFGSNISDTSCQFHPNRFIKICLHMDEKVIKCDSVNDILECTTCGQKRMVACNFDENYS